MLYNLRMPEPTPHILGLVTDLFFSSRVSSTAQALNFPLEPVESSTAFPAPQDFLARLRQAPPALVILDLDAALPWDDWLPAAKTDPELASIPWLAFGSHKQTELLARAKQAGADRVEVRSKFVAELPALIQSLLPKL